MDVQDDSETDYYLWPLSMERLNETSHSKEEVIEGAMASTPVYDWSNEVLSNCHGRPTSNNSVAPSQSIINRENNLKF